MAYFTYVIKSVHHNRLYKGQCQNLEKRLQEHNAGYNRSTKPFAPWEIVYFEKFETRPEAIAREKYFKSAAGRRFLKKKIQF